MTERALEKIIRGGIFLIPFIPLFFFNPLVYPLVTGKNFLFRIVVEILFIGWLALSLRVKKYRPKFSLVLLSLGIFIAVIFLADVLGVNPHLSLWGNFDRMEGFVGLVHLLIFFLVAGSIFTTKKDWNKFFQLSVGVSAIVSAIALFQLLGWLNVNTSDGRLDSTFGNATYLAFYLLLHIFLAWFLLAGESKLKNKIFYLGAIGLEIFILYFTATRGTIIALFIGTMATLILFELLGQGRRTLRLALGGIILTSVLVIISVAVWGGSLAKDSLILNRFSNIYINQIQTEPRYYLWLIAVKGFKDHPILGQGQENFNRLYDKYYEPALYKTDEAVSNRAHNVILEWLTVGGVLGLAAYLGLYLTLFYYLWFSPKTNFLRIGEKGIITGLITAYLVNDLFLFDNLATYLVFFSILAFLHSSVIKSVDLEKNQETVRLINHWSMAVLLAAAIGLISLVNAPAVAAAYYYKQGLDSLPGSPAASLAAFKKSLAFNSVGRDDIREGIATTVTWNYLMTRATTKERADFYQLAINGLTSELQEQPDDPRAYYLLGYVLYSAGQYDGALKFLDQAHRLAPRRQDILLAGSRVNAARGQFALAASAAEEAYRLDPEIEKVRLAYTISLMYVPLPKQDQLSLMSFLETHLAQVPGDTDARLALANAYLKLGEYTQALTLIKQAVAVNSSLGPMGEKWTQQIKKYMIR